MTDSARPYADSEQKGSTELRVDTLREFCHELANKLALSMGYVELLAHHPELPDHLRVIAREAQTGSRDATDVLNQMHRLLRESAAPADHSSVRPMSDPVRGVRLQPAAANARPTLGTVALAR